MAGFARGNPGYLSWPLGHGERNRKQQPCDHLCDHREGLARSV